MEPPPPDPPITQTDDNTSKKSPFDGLSREELIKKCKTLLLIAQKAKQAKAEVSNECEILKEQCQKLETQKSADIESIRMMQEFIDTLTEQKLNYATEVDSLKTNLAKSKSSSEKIQRELNKNKLEYEQQHDKFSKELNETRNRLSTIDTENTSLKRQNRRMQDENEGLIKQLDELEKHIEKLNKISLEQQQALLALENNSQDQKLENDDVSEINSLTASIESYKISLENSNKEKLELQNTVESLKAEVDNKNSQINKMNDDMTDANSSLSKTQNKLSEMEKQCETEKVKKEKLNARLKYCKEKLAKCNSSITQLKNSKSVLLKTVSDYSESVPKWQQDILNASKLLSEQLLKLESENIELKIKLDSMQNEKIEDTVKEEKGQVMTMEYDSVNAKLNSVTSEYKALEKEKTLCAKNLDSLKSEYDVLINNIKSLESEKLILINEKKAARDTIQRVEVEKSELQNAHQDSANNIMSLKNEIKRLKDCVDSLECEKADLVDSLKSRQDNKVDQAMVTKMKEELASLRSAIVSVEEENKLLCESNEMLKGQLDGASDEHVTPEMRKIVEQNDMLQTDISKLQTRIGTFKSENSSLISEVKESRQRLSELEALLKDHESIKGKMSNYKSENAELLKEMKEINQVIKERGETISKQYMEISELNRKVQILEEETKKIKEVNDQKDDEIKKMASKVDDDENEKRSWMTEKENLSTHWQSLLNERDHIIISLQEDIEKLKHNQGNVSYDARSDNMSVSTLSRVEESSRMRDLDESFEERYSKLRMLAIKLKKRVGELTLQNKSLEDANSKLEQEKSDTDTKLQKVGSTAKNVHSIQSEYDKIADEFERKKVEFNSQEKEYNKAKNEVEKLTKDLAAANISMNHFKSELETSKTNRGSTVKELQSQIASLKATAGDGKCKDTEVAKIQDTLTLKEAQLALEISQHQITKEALEKAKKEVKKKSVLSLEMEDYERSMKDLTNKMEDDKKKIIQMESTIDMQQATIVSLKTQIKMLEDQLNSEEKISKEIKDLLNTATENLKDKESVIASKNETIYELERNLEDSKQYNEDLNLQLASALGEREKSVLSAGQEKSELMARLKKNEAKYNEIDEKFQLKIVELESIRTEFTNYKVRAQSVLRQNQTKDLSVEENLKEEMAALKASLDASQAESDILKSQLETIQVEKVRLASRCSELQSAITSAQTEREKMSEQYSLLLQKETQEQKNIKLQMSTLTQCYKKQIAELEESSAVEVGKLKKELDFSIASLARSGIAISKESAIIHVNKPLQFIALNSTQSSTDSGTIPTQDRPEAVGEANVILLEREEGEGSESTPSPSPTTLSNPNRRLTRGRREPMPLDQLLENGIPEDGPGPYFDGDIEQQYASALKQIETQNKRVNHLTDLLAEAEKEVARRAQLGEALKEEVRRCQRALDRGLHHHNQEYLKNVIVKFLTLGAGDERSRLVPVLNTILTLSPEETHQLSAVAKGLDPNANKGWGSYLPWPGNR